MAEPAGSIDRPSPGEGVLRLVGASKSFAGVQALRDVSLCVQRGQVHGLLGQNGSGKSTLIKCLAGYHQPDPGWQLMVNGVELSRPLHSGESQHLGMSFVHQDLGLIPNLDVTDNLRMAYYVGGRSMRLSTRREQRATQQLLDEFAVEVSPRTTVERLRPVDRTMVAIVRAVDDLRRWKQRTQGTGGVLFLDEATAVLDRAGKARIADLVRRVTADGAGVVIVTHDIREAVSVADQVTLLRDGAVRDTVAKEVFTQANGIESLIESMNGQRRAVGATAAARRESPPGAPGPIAVTGLSGGLVQDFSVTLRQGEVLGVTGLVGGGWEDIPLLIFGAKRSEGGTLRLKDEALDLPRMRPGRAVRLGLGLVPANRQDDGVVGELSMRSNITLPKVRSYMRLGTLDTARERKETLGLLDRYGVVPQNTEMQLDALSGGNQQKAVMAKWLNMKPSLLVLQSPTQGVDVASRERIHDLVWRAAREGTAVIYASADCEELVSVADRVLVMNDGVITAELIDNEITEDILEAAVLRGGARGQETRFA